MPRVYLPATRDAVRRLAAGDEWTPVRVLAPPAPQERPEVDDEEREFEAFLAAAEASLRLLADDEHRRVVVSADLPTAQPQPVRLAQVAAWHIDDAEGAAVVGQVRAGASPTVLDDVALLWYSPDEVEAVRAELG
jgi:hypothetical protein